MKIKAVIATFVLSFFLFAAPVLAQTGKPTGTPPFKRGLTETRLRSCEAKETATKSRMKSLLRLAANIEEKFDAIAGRVKNFYTNKIVPSGKTLPNYDVLLADINTKKALIDDDLTAAQNKVNAFTCTADDPKDLLTGFRTDMQKVKTDLKNFRTSIKNLIVAVRGLK